MEDLKLASSEKCPLCGGDVLLGECSFCGYAVPDTEKLSAPYDLSPDNVTFSGYEDSDELTAIDPPDTSSMLTAKQIRDEAKQRRAAAEQRRAAERMKKSQAPNAVSANIANAPFVPYTKPDYGNSPKSESTSNVPAMLVKTVSDFVVCHWWKFLLTAIIPCVGYGFALFYFVINSDKERKKSELFFAAAILLTAILLQAANWDPTGLDTILQHFIMYFMREDYFY